MPSFNIFNSTIQYRNVFFKKNLTVRTVLHRDGTVLYTPRRRNETEQYSEWKRIEGVDDGARASHRSTELERRPQGGRWEVCGRVLGDLHRLQQYTLRAFYVLPLDAVCATASSAWQRDSSSS